MYCRGLSIDPKTHIKALMHAPNHELRLFRCAANPAYFPNPVQQRSQKIHSCHMHDVPVPARRFFYARNEANKLERSWLIGETI